MSLKYLSVLVNLYCSFTLSRVSVRDFLVVLNHKFYDK